MWQNPHVLILDEPTNYLDRDGLGALVLAIKDYKGGVLIISHNKEFCENVATEKWIMKGGYLRIEGQSVEAEKQVDSHRRRMLGARGQVVESEGESGQGVSFETGASPFEFKVRALQSGRCPRLWLERIETLEPVQFPLLAVPF